MPVAQTELLGTAWGQRAADLTDLTQFRLVVNQSVAGAAAAFLRVQYSSDSGATWHDLQSGGTSADLVVGAGTGLKVGAWGLLSTSSDVRLRIVGQSGDGIADPVFRYIGIEFR
jgi:hypothetical protein